MFGHIGTCLFCHLLKTVSMSEHYLFGVPIITWSNPLKNIDRTIQLVSKPNAAKNPAHSKATYDAPITRVFPGG